MSISRIIVAVALLLGTPSAFAQAPAPATPDEVTEARQLVRQANSLYLAGKFEEALPLYERVFKIFPTPATVYNLAQTYRQLRRYDRALSFYGSFLTMVPRSPKRPEVEQFIAEMNRVIGEQKKAGEMPPRTPLIESSPKRVEAATPTSKAVLLPPPPSGLDVAVTSPPDAPPGASPARSWYRRWYVWAAIGVAVTGAVVGGAVAAAGRGSLTVPEPSFGRMSFTFGGAR